MAEYLTVNDRALDSTGSGGIEGLGLRMVGGKDPKTIDWIVFGTKT